MIPNKKGLKVIIKGAEPMWNDMIFTLTGGQEQRIGSAVFYPVEEYDYEINRRFMVPLKSLKYLILNRKGDIKL